MLEKLPQHDFLVGIDSDGCVFDTMEVKHKECFIPAFVKHYGLQGVSKFARQAAEFVNLYSKDRGCNRFHALLKQLKLTAERPEVQARGYRIAPLDAVEAWTKRETKLGNPALEQAVQQTSDAELARALAWSKEVNQRVADMVREVPPFPYVRECLEKLKGKADVVVVSATPTAALETEWAEHGLKDFTDGICGQEVGTKSEILSLAMTGKVCRTRKEFLEASKRYADGHALMIGDAPGDHKAAQFVDAHFFPINPSTVDAGAEEKSWKALYDEGIARFFNGTFAGEYQKRLQNQFDLCLPERPPWV
jgi:phosphoglycolate phosphatase-like HAD superfamily hydrolase